MINLNFKWKWKLKLITKIKVLLNNKEVQSKKLNYLKINLNLQQKNLLMEKLIKMTIKIHHKLPYNNRTTENCHNRINSNNNKFNKFLYKNLMKIMNKY